MNIMIYNNIDPAKPPKPLEYADADIIDQFLSINPCYIPLRDPPVKLYVPRSNDTTDEFSGHGGSDMDVRSNLFC